MMTPNCIAAEVIATITEAHPKIFKGCVPDFPLSMPPGWGQLVDELCALFESRCTEEQLQGIEIRSIKIEAGALNFDINYSSALTVDQKEIFEARIFSIGSRSVFSCYVCGSLVKEWPSEGKAILCKKHEKK